MNSAMDAAVPGWRQINKDPKLVLWTKMPSSTAGKTRQQLLQFTGKVDFVPGKRGKAVRKDFVQ